MTNAPLVHSISYGEAEKNLDASTMNDANTEFMKMGTQGYTIIIASGDSGPYPRGDCTEFSSSFPGTSPYVTTVGAT